MHEGSELVIADWLASIEPFFHSPHVIADQSKQKMEHIYVLVLFSNVCGSCRVVFTHGMCVYLCVYVYIYIYAYIACDDDQIVWVGAVHSGLQFYLLFFIRGNGWRRNDGTWTAFGCGLLGPRRSTEFRVSPIKSSFFLCFFFTRHFL